jgi:alpha-glucoside transport system substrate-binding protein
MKHSLSFTFALSVLLLSACGGGSQTADGGDSPKTVTVLGVVVGEQQEKLEKALAPFEAETGIDVVYEGTDAFATLLPVRVESGDALRTAGPEVYDQWTRHEIPFNDGHVKTAFETFGKVVLNPKSVVGGSVGAISIPFGDAPSGLWSDPPNCYLHRQANFIASFFPEEVTLGQDVDVFLLPGINPAFGVPVLVAGDVFGMFNDTPEAQALMAYLATPEPHEIWAREGGFLSPHQQVSLEVYPDPVSRKEAEFLTTAETIRFDGSDLMPGAVGTGTFWSGIMDYVAGTPVEKVLDKIEQSWPQ